jgi:hypothetical protein
MWAVMSSEQPKEEIMKKLALIGIAILGLSLMIAVSPAGARPAMSANTAAYLAQLHRGEALNRLYQVPGKPALMTLPEYQALMARSKGLNQQYTVEQVKGENYYARGFVTAPDDAVAVKGENYFANGLPTQSPAVGSSTTSDFQWGDVGIGIAGAVGLVAIAALGVVGLRRHGLHPRTS